MLLGLGTAPVPNLHSNLIIEKNFKLRGFREEVCLEFVLFLEEMIKWGREERSNP